MKTKKITGIIIIVVLVLLITIGASYAYFSAALTGGETAETITAAGGSMNITYNGGSTITANNIYPIV